MPGVGDMLKSLALAIVALLAATANACADPCTAPLPSKGARFEGIVRYVGDGDSLCVGRSGDPKTWIEVRLADFYAPELHDLGGRDAKTALTRLAMGRPATCIARKRSYDRVVAQCEIEGRPIGAALRAAGVIEGGRGR